MGSCNSSVIMSNATLPTYKKKPNKRVPEVSRPSVGSQMVALSGKPQIKAPSEITNEAREERKDLCQIYSFSIAAPPKVSPIQKPPERETLFLKEKSSETAFKTIFIKMAPKTEKSSDSLCKLVPSNQQDFEEKSFVQNRTSGNSEAFQTSQEASSSSEEESLEAFSGSIKSSQFNLIMEELYQEDTFSKDKFETCYGNNTSILDPPQTEVDYSEKADSFLQLEEDNLIHRVPLLGDVAESSILKRRIF